MKYLHCIITPEEINLLHVLVETLEMFEEMSNHLAAENYVTTSVIIPLYAKINSSIPDLKQQSQATISFENELEFHDNQAQLTFEDTKIQQQKEIV